MEHIKEQEFAEELTIILAAAVGRDYAHYIVHNEDFFSAVIRNVEETSAWLDEGYYTDDDIRLAIGRVLMDKYSIEY